MADPILRQFSFTAGEISQEIEGKLDSSKRQQALRRLLNAYITFGGTLQKRPGLQFAATDPLWTLTGVPDPGVDYSPRIIRWAGSRDEPDLLLHISHLEGKAVFTFFNARGKVFENPLPWVPDRTGFVLQAISPRGFLLMRNGDTGNLVLNGNQRTNIFLDEGGAETAHFAKDAGYFQFRGTLLEGWENLPMDDPNYAAYTEQSPPFDYDQSYADFVPNPAPASHRARLRPLNDALVGLEFQATSRAFLFGGGHRRILDLTLEERDKARIQPYISYLADVNDYLTDVQINAGSNPLKVQDLVDLSFVVKLQTPYNWEHVWHREDEFDQSGLLSSLEQSASQPGLKFVQSSDVMTITHPDYPVYSLERSTAELTPWILKQTMFDFDQKAPTGLYIRNYRPRSPNEGFDPNRAEGRPVDFAVTAYNDTVGESRFGAALTDTRFLAPENSPGEIIAARTDGTTVAQDFTGFEVSRQNPGLFVRIALRNNQEEDDVKELFPPGTAVYFSHTRGTRGLEQRIFQVREFRGSVAKGEDDRVTHFSAVSGSAVTDLENTGWRGPWLVLEPAPAAKTFENIYARKQGTGDGPDSIGDEGPAEDADDTNPYNIGTTQVPE